MEEPKTGSDLRFVAEFDAKDPLHHHTIESQVRSREHPPWIRKITAGLSEPEEDQDELSLVVSAIRLPVAEDSLHSSSVAAMQMS
jgi:hypothetical protein